MTDRELLERAARAASLDVEWTAGEPFLGEQIWNPLQSDADAFRLMAKLNLNLGFELDDEGLYVHVLGIWDGGPDEVREYFERDATSAMRRAIVRAAAAMVEV